MAKSTQLLGAKHVTGRSAICSGSISANCHAIIISWPVKWDESDFLVQTLIGLPLLDSQGKSQPQKMEKVLVAIWVGVDCAIFSGCYGYNMP